MISQQASPCNLELDALIASGTVDLDTAQRSFLSRLPRERFDWDRFFKLVCGHRLVGVVTHHLRKGVFSQVPENVLHDFAASSRDQGRNNLWLTTVLLELLTVFKRADIPVISYKGPVMADQIYGDLEMRASTDLDLIVRPQDLQRTRDCLIEIGFEDGYGLGRTQQEAAFRFGFEHNFTRSGFKLDLHWGIAANWAARSLDMDAVFGRAILRPIFGTECLCLSDEDLIIALCFHAAQHDWGQLSQFVDIIETLRCTPHMDWDLIHHYTADAQIERILLVSLQIVSTNWHLDLPGWCRETIQRRPSITKVTIIARRTWATSAWPNQARLGLLERTVGENLRDRIATLVGIVLEPKIPDFRALRLPQGTWWLYWVLRPLRLLCKRMRWLSPKPGDVCEMAALRGTQQ